MKKPGCKSLFREERDLALVMAFKRELARRRVLDMDAIFKSIAEEAQAPRFYISEERALRVVRTHRLTGRWPASTPLRLRMYEEVERKALAYIEAGEADTLLDAIYLAVNDPAPSFYLTAQSVRSYIYKALQSLRARSLSPNRHISDKAKHSLKRSNKQYDKRQI